MADEPKGVSGRPTDYRPDYPAKARKIILMGGSENDLAEFFGCRRETLRDWQQAHPEFAEAISQARRERDPAVAPRVGRPTNYDPAFCDKVIEVARRGLSLTGFAGVVGVTKRSVQNWCEAHPDFAEACAIAKAVMTAAYEEKAWDIASGGGGPGAASMAQFALKNIAPDEYADTQNLRHAGPDGIALTPPVFNVTFVKPNGGAGD